MDRLLIEGRGVCGSKASVSIALPWKAAQASFRMVSTNPTTAAAPWFWTTDKAPWFDTVAHVARTWQPDTRLRLESSLVRNCLENAALRHERWLIHPCANALVLDCADRLQRDFQLSVWAAAHSVESLGRIVAPSELWIWTNAGGTLVPAGLHDLSALGQETSSSDSMASIALDVWCHSVGMVLRGSWAELGAPTPEQQEQLQGEIIAFLSAVNWTESIAPEIGAWLTSVTSVAVPFFRSPDRSDGLFHSESAPDLPGLVQLDLFGREIQILEALVHESAHRHLYMAEAQTPLIDPSCDRLFHSPLRVEPRPLHGILMAYHALAYICCFYRKAQATGLVSAQTISKELPPLLDCLLDAETTICTNRDYLTACGSNFLDQTLSVANDARN